MFVLTLTLVLIRHRSVCRHSIASWSKSNSRNRYTALWSWPTQISASCVSNLINFHQTSIGDYKSVILVQEHHSDHDCIDMISLIRYYSHCTSHTIWIMIWYKWKAMDENFSLKSLIQTFWSVNFNYHITI